jgi:hypothetical protein
MNLLALLPGRDWLYICAFMVLLGGGIGFVHHEREIGTARVEQVRVAEHAQAQAVAASAIATNQAETNRRSAATKETIHVTIQHAEAVVADASAAAGQLDGLRHDLAAVLRARAADPRPAGASAPAADADLVLAQLLERAADRAAGPAQLADQRGVSGSACERSYDSLTPSASPSP